MIVELEKNQRTNYWNMTLLSETLDESSELSRTFYLFDATKKAFPKATIVFNIDPYCEAKEERIKRGR